MSEPYLGEIKIVPYNFVPQGWANCDGQIIPISQNNALFALIGTTYGGDGVSTFALPDLRGRFPMHVGNGPGLTPRNLGQKAGTETNALNSNHMASHNHTATILSSTDEGDRSDPTGAYPARPEEPLQPYGGSTGGTMASGGVQVGNSGGGQAFNNVPPFLVLRFIIAMVGLFPSTD